MKVRKLKNGEKVEVGDMLQHLSWMGKKWFKVERVTARYAIVRINEVHTEKYPREVKEIGYCPCGRRDIWSTVTYSIWRPIPSETETSSAT